MRTSNSTCKSVICTFVSNNNCIRTNLWSIYPFSFLCWWWSRAGEASCSKFTRWECIRSTSTTVEFLTLGFLVNLKGFSLVWGSQLLQWCLQGQLLRVPFKCTIAHCKFLPIFLEGFSFFFFLLFFWNIAKVTKVWGQSFPSREKCATVPLTILLQTLIFLVEGNWRPTSSKWHQIGSDGL